MTPSARLQAAIEILDLIFEGEAAEKTLTTWARKNRYAGSKDRAAIRDLVYDALRNARSYAALSGAEKVTGRSVMIGRAMNSQDTSLQLFDGGRFGPDPISVAEQVLLNARRSLSPGERLNLPDWCVDLWLDRFGDMAEEVATLFGKRASLGLRVNTAKTTRVDAREALAADRIETTIGDLASTALIVAENERQLAKSKAYLEGLVEIQDVASQAAIEMVMGQINAPGLPSKVLDLCAGGGGKSLAFATNENLAVFAHDIAPQRMKDIEPRAKRAGVKIQKVRSSELGSEAVFDCVVIDAPCSGSGTWRRTPGAKWRLERSDLNALLDTQSQLLQQATGLSQRYIAYMTCSVFKDENEEQIRKFLEKCPEWSIEKQEFFKPSAENDGFFCAILRVA